MKKIVCELCEGTEFTKDGGMFVCQGCGTKYTAEEARGMMREVEGGAAPVGGVPMGNPNQQQLDNILMLATNAFSASNNEETEKYCNRAIELDATCYKAWFLKGKAAGWSSTIQNPRIAEAAHSFKQAVDFAPDDEKESLTEEAAEELKRLGLACISLRKNRFSKYPDKEELNGFVSDIEPLIEGLIILLSKQNDAAVAKANSAASLLAALGGNIASIKFIGIKSKAVAAGVPKEYFAQIADMMADAAVAGFNKSSREYNNENRPMERDFKKCMNEIDNCISLIGIAIDASDDDGDDDIERYKNRIKMQEYVINMTCYGDYSSYSRGVSLTDEAKRSRRKNISDWKDKIKEVENKAKEKAEEERKKAEEEKKARIAAYWEAHADEKAALDAEKKELEDKKTKLNAEIAEQDKLIKAAEDDKKATVPSEAETDKIKSQIKELESRRAKLGLFAGKEKKQIGEEIASLDGRVNALKGKIEEEKKARDAEADKKAAPAKAKKDELQNQVNTANKRISAIDAALTKDPEE